MSYLECAVYISEPAMQGDSQLTNVMLSVGSEDMFSTQANVEESKLGRWTRDRRSLPAYRMDRRSLSHRMTTSAGMHAEKHAERNTRPSF